MNRWNCVYCGRPTAPYVTLGGLVVGPKCAKRMGLTKPAAKKNPRIKWHAPQKAVRVENKQADLFEGAACSM